MWKRWTRLATSEPLSQESAKPWKDSQHYSDEFGFAVLSIYEEYQQKHRSDADQCDDLESLDPLDVSTAAWADLDSAALWASLYEE